MATHYDHATTDRPSPHARPLGSWKGWTLYDNGASFHPATGRYEAWRHGVRIGASTYAQLGEMLHAREGAR